jgi:hypothetical protein
MARNMKTVTAPRKDRAVFFVRVDPLRVLGSGRRIPGGAVHKTARRPSRARSKRELSQQLAGA